MPKDAIDLFHQSAHVDKTGMAPKLLLNVTLLGFYVSCGIKTPDGLPLEFYTEL